MDDIVILIFTIFVFILLSIGFFRKHNLLIIFSGIGFVLLGLFLVNGFSYISGQNITTVNSTFMIITDVTSVWNSTFKNYLFAFFCLFGLFLILTGGIDLLRIRKADMEPPREEEGEE